MTTRRTLVRLRRRLRRPSLPRLVVASLALHLAGLTLAGWLVSSSWTPPAPPAAPRPPPAGPRARPGAAAAARPPAEPGARAASAGGRPRARAASRAPGRPG